MTKHIVVWFIVLALASVVLVKGVEVLYEALETTHRMPEALRGLNAKNLGIETVIKEN